MAKDVKKGEAEVRQLPCVLTAEQLDEYRDKMARTASEQETLEDEKKSTMSYYKDKLDRCMLDMRNLAKKITNRSEVRDVNCTWYLDFINGTKSLVRDDTGEVVTQKPMDGGDLQQRLPGGSR